MFGSTKILKRIFSWSQRYCAHIATQAGYLALVAIFSPFFLLSPLCVFKCLPKDTERGLFLSQRYCAHIATQASYLPYSRLDESNSF